MDRMRLERPDPGYIAEMYNNCVFQVFCVSSEIIQQHVVESPFSTPNTKINMFHPIDARPQWDGVDMKSFRMEDMAIFRPISPDSEIVVHPDMIPKLMKDIRKAQAPKQKEIREKKRKEAMRNNTQKIDGYDAAKDIKATLVVAKG